jgi:type VI secretion system protein ImpC
MPRRIDPRQDELVACIDSATQTLMSALLHHPHFQQLEAAWRSLDLLIRRVETDVTLKIFLVDVSKVELALDLLNNQDLASSGLYRLLVEQTTQTPGAVPWSLICGFYKFGESHEDVQLLGQLARVTSLAQAPFLSAADGSLVGCQDAAMSPEPNQWSERTAEFQERWDELCNLSEAANVSLLWPRFLLRLPYGAATKPIDAFAFEEMPRGMRHEHLLWGNPVVLAACAIGQSFTEAGWDLHLAQGREFTDLPIITDKEDGETRLHPCGEVLLTDRSAEHLRRRGITPVLSLQGRNAIRLPTLQSIRGTVLGES